MTILIDIFYLFVVVLYLPFVVFRRKWYTGLSQRLGMYPADIYRQAAENPVMWVHAVSVGEVFAVVDLVKQLRKDFPAYRIFFSTVTITGYEIARKNFGEDAEVILAPADLSWIVRRTVARLRPRIYIAAETELWPNLYDALYRQKVPVVLVNGRISDKSFGNYRRAKFFFRRALKAVRIFAMQTAEDAQRIIALGAEPERVKVVGNLKFKSLDTYTQTVPFDHLAGHPILLGGSTHPGEEELLLRTLKELRREYPEMRLILAPRHIERTDEVLKIVTSFGMTPRLIPDTETAWSQDEVIVIDRMGLLRSLYQVATLVFIGKSFAVGGGQNMIEPVALGKPTFVGPMTQNFRDVVSIFLREKVLFRVIDQGGLAGEMLKVLKDTKLREDLLLRAPEVINRYDGTKDRIVTIITETLSTDSESVLRKSRAV